MWTEVISADPVQIIALGAILADCLLLSGLLKINTVENASVRWSVFLKKVEWKVLLKTDQVYNPEVLFSFKVEKNENGMV